MSAREIAALEENLWSNWSQFGGPEGCAFTRTEKVFRLDTPIASLPYNGVFKFSVEETEADVEIDALMNHYEKRGVDHLWVIHPTASPTDLDERLNRRGFREAENCTGMIAGPEELKGSDTLPDGLVIHEVGAEHKDVVMEMVASRWQVPSEAVMHLHAFYQMICSPTGGGTMRGWLALLDGHPVGKAFTHRNNGVIGLYGVATKPEARGKGVAAALCLRALRESVMSNDDLLVLHSSPMAENLYCRMGFRPVAPFRIFARDGAFHV